MISAINYDILNELGEKAQAWMAEYSIRYDDAFAETDDEEQIDFAGIEGESRELCWYKCKFLTDDPHNPGLLITFGVFYPGYPNKISKAFFCGKNAYSREETEEFKQKIEEHRRKAAERAKNEKEKEKRLLEHLRKRSEAASIVGCSLISKEKKLHRGRMFGLRRMSYMTKTAKKPKK